MFKRSFLLFAALLTIFFGAISFAQEDAREQTAEEETAQVASEPIPAEPVQQPLLKITAIEVKGNKSISSNTVISKMKARVGADYQENIISDDLKRLYLLGFFSDVKIDAESYKEGVKVIVSVVERPIIEAIDFSGIRRLTMKDGKLKEQLKSKETQYLDYPSLSEDVRTLEKMYEKKGYVQAKVDYKVDLDEAVNKAKVHFSITEGGKVRVKKINIEGNDSFKDRRLLKLLKTKSAWLFNAGVLKEEVLKEDMERLRAFYLKEGFTDVTIAHTVSSDPDKSCLLYINITVQEGKKYLVGNVTVQGNKDISQEGVLSKLKACVPGKVYSAAALKADVSGIQGLYFDKGYISVVVQETTSVNAHTGRVDIIYNITENEIAYVDKIKIKGNIKTKDVVIRRELRIYPGDRFDGAKLKRSKERLQNLGFFEDVSYDTEDTEAPNKKDLVVDVKESKTGAFSFGGGYSTVDQLVGFFEIEQKNFDWKNFPYFTGDGQDLKFRASFGSISSGFDLSFTDPWAFDYPLSLGFDAYKRTRDREEDVGYGYDEDITGGDLRAGYELTEYVRGNLTYRFDQIEISNVDPTATQDLKNEEGKNSISSVTFGLSFDNRDSIFFPRKGDLLSGSLELAGGPFAGDKDFWKFYGRASHYFPMPREASLEFRGRVGLADEYGDSPRVPIYERFFAGGAYTVRGYDERSLGPIDPVTKDPLGGEALFVGNIEYTYPLFDFLKVAAFYDMGNVYAQVDDFELGDLKSSFGFGVRIKTPIGPIMLDFGIPLDTAPGEESKGSGKLHFSASHGF